MCIESLGNKFFGVPDQLKESAWVNMYRILLQLPLERLSIMGKT